MNNVDWNRAHLLALVSQWAYRDESVGRAEALEEGRFSRCDYFQVNETRGMVVSNETDLVLAFRGSANLENWLRNLNFLPVDRGYATLHGGFAECFEEVRSEAWRLLSAHGLQTKRVWLTGHSLGGALATILAAEFSQYASLVAGIYTFGQPCAGQQGFADFFNHHYRGRCFRFVHGEDVVTRLPPGYAHVAELVPLGDSRRGGESLLTEDEWADLQEDLRRAPAGESTRAENTRFFDGLQDHRLPGYLELLAAKAGLAPADRGPVPAMAVTSPIIPVPGPTPPARKRAILPPVEPVETSGEPPVVVHLLWSPESQNGKLCPQTAEALFSFLCHRSNLRADVETGVNIPVFAGHHVGTVRAKVAALSAQRTDHQLLVVVLLLDGPAMGDASFLESCHWFLDLATNPTGPGSLLVIPVYLDGSRPLPVPDLVQHRLVPSDSATKAATLGEKNRAVIRDVAKALCRRLAGDGAVSNGPLKPVQVILNFEENDDAHHKIPLEQLNARFNASVLRDFVSLVPPAESIQPQNLAATFRESGSLSLVLRTDSFAASLRCQERLLHCKRLGMPVVTIQILRTQERLSPRYAGNSPTLVWNPSEDEKQLAEQADSILDEILLVWLRHLHFHLTAPLVFQRQHLPFHAFYLSRPPELVDFAQGTLASTGASLVLYPDPPLPLSEINLIRHSFPRVRFATPSTLSRELLRRVPTVPLRGKVVALSLSHFSPDIPASISEVSPDCAGTACDGGGVLQAHIYGTIKHLALCLIRAGATLAYGSVDQSFSRLLSDLTLAHWRYLNDSGDKDHDARKYLLRCYVARFVLEKRQEVLESIRAELRPIPAKKPDVVAEAPEAQALELSQTRLAMARDCDVRIILGGRRLPKESEDDKVGYKGRFPGQAEEAFLHLQAGKPLYVIGGFGGVAGDVARVLQGDREGLATEASLREGNPLFRELCQKYDRQALGEDAALLPHSLDDLWAGLAGFGQGMFWGDASAGTRWIDNGLSKDENLTLFRSTRHDEISALILRGLRRLADRETQQEDAPAQVSLFNGSITEVLDTEAYAVLVLGSARLRGADGALDERLGGALGRHLNSGQRENFLAIQDDRLAGSYIIPKTIGDLSDLESVEESQEKDWWLQRIDRAVREVVEACQDQGIESVAMVPFGRGFGLSAADSIHAIVCGFVHARKDGPVPALTICEHDPDHYTEVVEAVRCLAGDEGPSTLVFTQLPPKIPAAIRAPVYLSIRERHNSWLQFSRAPGTGGAVAEERIPVDWSGLEELFGRVPPSFKRQHELGKLLAERVFSKAVITSILQNRGRSWDVLHDLAASVIPFELLAFPLPSGALFRPALTEGIRHGLFTGEVPILPPYRREGAKVQLLIVANPTGDLPGTEKEADEIAKELQQDPLIEVVSLIGPQQATKAAVLQALADGRFDLVHYAGHGKFDTADPRQGGLMFPGGEMLTENDLEPFRSRSFEGLPMLVFLNACETAKVDDIRNAVRGSTSLAHRILGSGIRGFVSNRWEVGDDSAAAFAISLYRSLAKGLTLGAAMLKARQELFDAGRADWANYLLYGSPDIHL
ncbi:MAG: CHAT domain-containing protein [Verrucomicrobia bacterium]|nr:CHAT domain-containing protein [Verrucomicrobiota bacterium]